MSTGAQFLEPMSSSSMNNFLATFHTNESHAQPNQYEVEIFPPFNSEDNRAIQLRCESVTLPGRNLSSTGDTNVHGPLREVVNNVNYDDSVPMVFQASADLRERVFFEKWQYTAFNPDTWNVGYYDEYIGEVNIYLLDRQNQRKYGLKLMECFPKSIGPTELSYGANNEIIKLTINMNFRYWKTLDITQFVTAGPAAIDTPGAPSSAAYHDVHPFLGPGPPAGTEDGARPGETSTYVTPRDRLRAELVFGRAFHGRARGESETARMIRVMYDAYNALPGEYVIGELGW